MSLVIEYIDGETVVRGDPQTVSVILAHARSDLSHMLSALRGESSMRENYGRVYRELSAALETSSSVRLNAVHGPSGVIEPQIGEDAPDDEFDDLL